MKNRKGFTLIELMVVILIVAILAAVAIPIMRGRIDAAKWSEGKASGGTIATAIRALCAEREADSTGVTGSVYTTLGFNTADMDGTYFTNGCYDATWTYVNATGALSFTVTIDATQSSRVNYPTTAPPTKTLIVVANGPAIWSN